MNSFILELKEIDTDTNVKKVCVRFQVIIVVVLNSMHLCIYLLVTDRGNPCVLHIKL